MNPSRSLPAKVGGAPAIICRSLQGIYPLGLVGVPQIVQGISSGTDKCPSSLQRRRRPKSARSGNVLCTQPSGLVTVQLLGQRLICLLVTR